MLGVRNRQAALYVSGAIMAGPKNIERRGDRFVENLQRFER